MVDMGATTRNAASRRDHARGDAAIAGPIVDIRPADDVAMAQYEAFCVKAVHGAPQHPLWIRAWVMAAGADAITVTLHRNGRAAVALVLEITRKGPFRVASFPAGQHANGNFVACAAGLDGPLTGDDVRALERAIRAARPDIDLIELERQKPHLDGKANPLGGFATMQSPNISLATDLSGGMEATLDRMNGKRKRKKYRAQLRKLEAAGGHRWFEAKTAEDVDRLMNAFYTLKAARFRKRGIPDVFAQAEVKAFFRSLFIEALEQSPPPFTLYGLEVAGEIHNVKGFSVISNGLISEFCAMRDDDRSLSPGFFLDYEVMQESCAKGMTIYDFSVGDEEYKRSWCDIETWFFETLLPLTAKGRMLFAYKVARARAVGFVKSNKALWDLARRVRTRLGGGTAATSETGKDG
ncbi:GNAT family N-acetyltransferase [Mesorhizobium sp. CAU 1741]|uniref:GNAT family N-acetyltransferase n=1 Tax=Mesorhizobium sp. CAU 1741 TaxID=3140366 RepID=UPI00325B7304